MQDGLKSPIIQKYQKALEADPNSRVFAPLAECYRRLGLIDKAFEILKEGIKRNPDYVLGYLGLAFCYADKGEHQLVYSTLRPLVSRSRDNLRLQKLFAQSCLKINHQEEALETYKFLLFLNPKDQAAALKVQELDREVPVLESRKIETSQNQFDLSKIKASPDSDLDSWVQKDFSKEKKTEENKNEGESWEVENKSALFDPQIEEEIETDEELNEFEPKKAYLESELSEGPVITHTLVDLYCAQGHFLKAIEILEKILLLNPDDEKTELKLKEVKSIAGEDSFEEKEMPDDEPLKIPEENLTKETFPVDAGGRQSLMDYFDAKIAEQIDEFDTEEDSQDSTGSALTLENKRIAGEPHKSDSPDETQLTEKRDRLMSFLGAIKVRSNQVKRTRG